MFQFLENLRNASIPARERAAFIAALVVTVGIGAVWFSLSFGTHPERTTERRAEDASVPSASADTTEGPLARLRVEVADAAVAIAAEVGALTNLWKSRLFPAPLQFERADTPEGAPGEDEE